MCACVCIKKSSAEGLAGSPSLFVSESTDLLLLLSVASLSKVALAVITFLCSCSHILFPPCPYSKPHTDTVIYNGVERERQPGHTGSILGGWAFNQSGWQFVCDTRRTIQSSLFIFLWPVCSARPACLGQPASHQESWTSSTTVISKSVTLQPPWGSHNAFLFVNPFCHVSIKALEKMNGSGSTFQIRLTTVTVIAVGNRYLEFKALKVTESPSAGLCWYGFIRAAMVSQ